MEDTKYFNCLKHFLENLNMSIVNNTSIQGENSDLNCFIKRLSELGLDYVMAKSIKYESNLLK